MTISSSLNAGVAGLNANAARLATISDNISNSATLGYKRSAVEFHTMVVGGESPTGYVAGGVRATNIRLVDQRGSLVGTSNATDISVGGRGFLPVAAMETLDDAGRSDKMMMMTTASFRIDENGLLRTTTGQVLLGWAAQADGTVPLQPRDSVAGLEAVRLNMGQASANPTTAMAISLNLPATATRAGAAGTSEEISSEYFTNLGLSETLRFNFSPSVPAAGASNEWTMTVTDSASAAVVGQYTLTFDDSTASGGMLASVTTLSGGAWDPATGEMTLTLAGGPMTLSIGRIGEPGGLTQLSNKFVPTAPIKNGSPMAGLVGVEVDSRGNLFGIYDQGFSRLMYQIPVVDVRNPNGLTAFDNQTYQTSLNSGSFFLWDAGTGPAGPVSGYTREESSTDVAQELTQLIQTQRAYSSNAKVIQTVDEMLQETANLKR